MSINKTKTNIYLIGYRATGKTVVGRKLAEQLGRRFVDADQYLEQKAGMPVSEIVSRFSWEDFRSRESAVIAELSNQNNLVVATGGGVVLDPQNVNILKQTGIVIWLDASPDTIISRMENDPNTKTQRPALSDRFSSMQQEVKQTLAQRLDLYEKASDIRIVTDNKTPDDICNQIGYQIKE